MHKSRTPAPKTSVRLRTARDDSASEADDRLRTARGNDAPEDPAAQLPQLPQLPQLDCWQGLSAQEREYRSIKLKELARRIQRDGPHQALPSAQRARQFMPFAALKGYDELAHSKECWEE